jgi:hypothetical protein
VKKEDGLGADAAGFMPKYASSCLKLKVIRLPEVSQLGISKS